MQSSHQKVDVLDLHFHSCFGIRSSIIGIGKENIHLKEALDMSQNDYEYIVMDT
jgi:hypothetical protein